VCYIATKEIGKGGTPMLRRDLLKAGLGAAAALAAPRIGGAAAAKTLVVAPTSDLVVLDPVVTFNRQTRNYAYLVFALASGTALHAPLPSFTIVAARLPRKAIKVGITLPRAEPCSAIHF